MLLALALACRPDPTLEGRAGDDDDDEDCLGTDVYAPGFARESAGSGTTVALVAADPEPPDVGENRWTLGLTDPGGAPVAGAAPRVTPTMPLHGHGLVPADYAAVEGDEPGTYAVDPFDLVMPGVWQFTIELGTADAPDGATFLFCAEG